MSVSIYLPGSLSRTDLPGRRAARDAFPHALIQESGLCAPLDALAALADMAVPVAAFSGDWIVNAEWPARGLYMLVAGAVELYSSEGTYLVTLAGKGAFAQDALVSGQSGIGGARAASTCNLWFLEHGSLARIPGGELIVSSYRPRTHSAFI